MVEFSSREHLQPSLLDRLTDNAPDRKQEAIEQQSLTIAQFRNSVLRDIGWLLNTTRLDALEDLDTAPLAAKSTINYGIPAFAGMVNQQLLATALEGRIVDAIRTYEPRIKPETLRVRLRNVSIDAMPGMVSFEIEGELWARPVPLQLLLETSMDVETGLAVVVEKRPRG